MNTRTGELYRLDEAGDIGRLQAAVAGGDLVVPVSERVAGLVAAGQEAEERGGLRALKEALGRYKGRRRRKRRR